MNQKLYYHSFQCALGFIKLVANEKYLLEINFQEEAVRNAEKLPEIIIEAEKQLNEYFEGVRKQFDIGILLNGSNFQKAIWEEVIKVPFGETASYMDIARALKNVKAIRAVGLANGKNKFPIVIPCHRIIGSNCKLTGYSGGLWRKKWLLNHERNLTAPKGKLF